jgi:hypothetical protein
MDVGDWLRSLGLEQYGAAFPDNAIDASILPSLTAEELTCQAWRQPACLAFNRGLAYFPFSNFCH